MTFIYILELVNNKYYIGSSKNPNKRINRHCNKRGSVWTKINKPIKTIDIIKEKSKFDEDFITIQYMEKYGIENVRGGTFSQITLKEEEINIIKKMLDTKNNRCYKCGGTNHYINECYLNNQSFNDDNNFNFNINNQISFQNQLDYNDYNYNYNQNYEYDENDFNEFSYLGIISNQAEQCWWVISNFLSIIKTKLCILKSYHYTDIDEYLEEHYNTDTDSDVEEEEQEVIINENKPKKFTFGRYKNRTYDDIILKEPNYVKWCLKQHKPSRGLKLFVDYYNSHPELTLTNKKNN
tara:strand:+ start:115 stop:996 length:882 start_codon:yes stop_codon:yes gene_type:complete